jgi:NADH-quinone oxidoreductase subunit C
MPIEELKESLSQSLPGAAWKDRPSDPSGFQGEITLDSRDIRTLFRLLKEKGCYLETITALDFPDHFELVYILCLLQPLFRILARTKISKDAQPVSISKIYPGAIWMEREVYDFYGIKFLGHPDLKRILLPDDATIYPLRKDFGKTKLTQEIDELL